jgi:hypothetical protein
LLNKLRGIKVGDIDVGELATSAVNDLQSSVAGIKDEATAQAALPGLTKASSEFDQLTGLLGQLTPEARKTVTEIFAAIKPNLDQLLDMVLGIPGVGTVIKPAVDAIAPSSSHWRHLRVRYAGRHSPDVLREGI